MSPGLCPASYYLPLGISSLSCRTYLYYSDNTGHGLSRAHLRLTSGNVARTFKGDEPIITKGSYRITLTVCAYLCASGLRGSPQLLMLQVIWWTTNARQSLAYSPLIIVVSIPREYLWNAPNYPSPHCSVYHTLPSSKRSWTSHGKIITAGHTNSYVLNSGVS